MSLKNKALSILLFICISNLTFAQKEKEDSHIKEPAKESKDTYNKWSLGLGLNSLKTYGDLSSYGGGDLERYTNIGFYIYGDYMFNPILGLEFKLDYAGLGAAGSGYTGNHSIHGIDEAIYGNQILTMDGSKTGIELNGIVNLSNLWKLDSKRWSWSLIAGIGLNYINSTLYDNTETSILEYNDVKSSYVNGGIDLKYRLNKRFDIALRPTLNLNYTDNFDAAISSRNNYETYFATYLGVVYKFGKEKRHAIWANNEDIGDERFQVVDTDEDGVIDEVDKEPETPTEAMVYGSGISVDSDMDGVPDHIDKCPFLRGIEANEGCPEDRDGDGVYDYDDVCPDVKGVAENLGCPRENTADDITNRIFLLAKSIYFKTNSDQIIGDSYTILNEIANIMLQYPKTQFSVDGHSDNTGEPSYNLYLSKKRAASVQKYLTNKGVNESRLYAEGYGMNQPTHSNKTYEGRKRNRRVEINYIQPDSEKGKEIYEEGVNPTESLTVIQPNIAGDLKDSDGDGVADLFDEEPNTPKGALVYGNGVAVDTDKDGLPDYMDECPLLAGPEENRGCPENSVELDPNNAGEFKISDTDQDGVMDALDIDNNTPYGAKVYGNGVAIDTDNDGVIDFYDNCPLKQGTEENEGCPDDITIESKGGKFNINDSDGDGVIDTLDKEPNTPLDARVYGNGVAVDTDGDGIPDYKDACPLKYGSKENNGCPVSPDSDGDGVPNEFDKEPNTPFGVKVYGNGVAMDTDSDGTPDHEDACKLKPGPSSNAGCPEITEETTGATIQLTDTDNDGVMDQFDQEPNTPIGAKVYGNGVAVDSDNDGIPDHEDKCPNISGTMELEGCAPVEDRSNINVGAGIALNGQNTTQQIDIDMTDSDQDGVMDKFDKEKNTPKGAKVYGDGVSIDTDGDGIPDHSDKCPLVAGTKELNGCPKETTSTKESQEIQLTDSDNDGVIDQFDKDPNTPAGALVYGNGIPIDSDRDGLPDYKDKCPLKAGPVENEGCPKSAKEFDWNDDDGDGVVNEFDKEPNTPAEARVYGNGVAIDSDYDDVPDHIDDCPFEKGSVENKGCPEIEGAVEANIQDTDKDGVLDIYDKEPDTPYGVKVYSNGVSLDSDKDEVPDYKDRCPKIKGLPENEGCPKEADLDGDGVSDADDLCPDVPGTMENKGCPNKNFDKSVYLKIEALAQKIEFERTKNTLSNDTMNTLDEILKIMQEYPATKFEIASHTDNKHNEKYSLFLSKRRANAILKYLVDGGVNEDRLTSEGYGDTQPKFSNTADLATSELNNRIEFNFQN